MDRETKNLIVALIIAFLLGIATGLPMAMLQK